MAERVLWLPLQGESCRGDSPGGLVPATLMGPDGSPSRAGTSHIMSTRPASSP